jgi:ABC-type multidrug transport system ATPase subunit
VEAMEELINIKNVNKYYGGIVALEDISLSIGRGESILLLGPNGAGKTTLFRCILGILRFEGEILIDGLNVSKEEKRIRRLIGYIPQNIGFPLNWWVDDLINYYLSMHDAEWNDEVLEKLGVHEYIDLRISELSGGMKQKLAIALVASIDPEIIILDEPLSNLDAEARKIFIGFMEEWRRHRKTILLSSHRINELLPFITRLIVLYDGELIGEVTQREFLELSGYSRVIINTSSELDVAMGNVIARYGDIVIIESNDILGLMRELSEVKHSISSIIVEEPSIEMLMEVLKKNE